jgi:hypothetical protein
MRVPAVCVDADVVDECCVRLPVARDAVGADGSVADPEFRARLTDVLATLALRAR